MPLQNFSDEQIVELKDEMLAKVPENGNAIGNKTLRETELHWDGLKYLAVRALLIKDGVLTPGRGKGGSIKRTTVQNPNEYDNAQENVGQNQLAPQPAPDENEQVAAYPEYTNEAALYEPMSTTLENVWIVDQKFAQSIIVNTDQGGRRRDGKWSRPDITILANTTYRYIRGKIFDVVTFEIKYRGALDVTAVYEALSHKKAATKSFVIGWVPREDRDEDLISMVANEAQRHGIGLIIAEDPADWETWEVVIDAIRDEPDPAELNKFLSTQIPGRHLDDWTGWLH